MRLPIASFWLAAPACAWLLSACQPDPCAELVDRTCGDAETCAASVSCRNARDLLEAGVDSACREALDNSNGYPECGG